MFGTREVETTPEQPSAFITLADVKALLGITGTDQDARLNALILVACASAEQYIGGVIFQRAIVERIYPEDAVGALTVSRYPIIEVTTFEVDDEAQTLSEFFITKSAGMIRNKEGLAISGRRIDVEYTAGYAANTYPAPLVEAALQLCKDLYHSSKLDGAIAKESVPDVGSVEYRDGTTYFRSNGVAVSAHVAALLAPFVQRGV